MIATVLIRDDKGEWIPEGTIKPGPSNSMVADTLPAQRIMDTTYHWNGRDYSHADGEEFLRILPLTVNGSYVRVVLEEEAVAPQRHERDLADMADSFARIQHAKARNRGYSSIPRLILDIDAKSTHSAAVKAGFSFIRWMRNVS